MTKRKKSTSTKTQTAGVQNNTTNSLSDRGPGVSAEERHRLAECRAFFKAAQYRQAAPDEIRQRDIQAAEAEIEVVLTACDQPKHKARVRK